jgi:hypothetical protein
LSYSLRIHLNIRSAFGKDGLASPSVAPSTHPTGLARVSVQIAVQRAYPMKRRQNFDEIGELEKPVKMRT